ncbi:hypothetical protein G6F58_000922 [Rhizopus delemar]|nr:hypothetical protein G6F58_000922 [Rhizopus delemar]
MSATTDRTQRPLLSKSKKLNSLHSKSSPTLNFDESHSLVSLLPLSKQHVTNSLVVVQNGIPYCKFTIDLRALKGEKLIQEIRKLVSSLFPNFASSHSLKHEFKLDRVSGAMTNAVYFVTIGSKRMLLRVYGIGCEQILDRDKELDWLSRLSRLNIGPSLLGTFDNGRFEEYLESTTLTWHDLRDPFISAQIASRLNQLHSIVDAFPPAENESLEVWQNIDKWYHSLESEILSTLKKNPVWAKMIEQRLDLSQLHKDIETCKSILNTLSTPTVFAHNDTQYGNILKIENTDELVVIDFEYSGYNPRGYDIANHFCEWMYDYHSSEPAKMNHKSYPTHKEQVRFLTAYDKHHVTELLQEVELWKMACHLFWGLWGLVQASQSEIDFDYFGYSLERLSVFKQELDAKTTQYTALCPKAIAWFFNLVFSVVGQCTRLWWFNEQQIKDISDIMKMRLPNYEYINLDSGCSDDLHDVKLIDYGSACIEHEMPLNYHIQTAFYRSPEVILRIPYDCSIDMWSFGCFVAEMFIGKPLFPSGNEAFLLYMMIATLKSLPPDSMLKKGIKSTAFFHLKGTQSDVTRLREKFTHDFQSLDERVMGCESEETNEDRICLLDFLKKILVYEPDKRYTPQQALNHPFITSSQPHSTSHIHSSLSISPTTEESSEIKTPPIKILPSTKPLKSILKKKESMDLKGLVLPPQPQLENTLDSTIAFLYQPRPLIQPDPSLLQKNYSHPTLMMYPSYYPQYQPNQSSRHFSP